MNENKKLKSKMLFFMKLTSREQLSAALVGMKNICFHIHMMSSTKQIFIKVIWGAADLV
jgi:hypothetical protein